MLVFLVVVELKSFLNHPWFFYCEMRQLAKKEILPRIPEMTLVLIHGEEINRLLMSGPIRLRNVTKLALVERSAFNDPGSLVYNSFAHHF